MPEQPQIRIIKKTGGHEAHHGGAWKVAFADFMTAMMAFFLVMWILGLSEETRKAIQGYFNDPVGFTAGFENGRNPLAMTGNKSGEKSLAGAKSADSLMNAVRRTEKSKFEKAEQQIKVALKQMKGSTNLASQVEVTVTDEGLLIELVDRTEIGFFELGSKWWGRI
jgi:chemotaxis protein MotB